MVRNMTYREVLREAMREEMQRDDLIFLLGQDVGAYGGEHGVSGDLVF